MTRYRRAARSARRTVSLCRGGMAAPGAPVTVTVTYSKSHPREGEGHGAQRGLRCQGEAWGRLLPAPAPPFPAVPARLPSAGNRSPALRAGGALAVPQTRGPRRWEAAGGGGGVGGCVTGFSGCGSAEPGGDRGCRSCGCQRGGRSALASLGQRRGLSRPGGAAQPLLRLVSVPQYRFFAGLVFLLFPLSWIA